MRGINSRFWVFSALIAFLFVLASGASAYSSYTNSYYPANVYGTNYYYVPTHYGLNQVPVIEQYSLSYAKNGRYYNLSYSRGIDWDNYYAPTVTISPRYYQYERVYGYSPYSMYGRTYCNSYVCMR